MGRCISASHRRPLPSASRRPIHRFLLTFDNKATSEPHAQGPGYFYGTIRLELAEDPQTILAYEMNGQPLPIVHGAPLRLRVETQLGFTMVKYIRAIEFVKDYKTDGQGQGAGGKITNISVRKLGSDRDFSSSRGHQTDTNGDFLMGRHSRKCLKRMAGTTGLEPATSAVTGQRSNQLNYVPRM